ncbi:HEXXH motif domain containing protein [Actinobacteria bacterium OK074]|nr:HEXXH motif domain containing protein [Actinobacteria bacterium OK074]
MPSAFPEHALRELGRTEGSPDTLALLVRDQHTRRLLLLRALLDAVEAADERICPSALRARLRADWALLEAADEVAAASVVGGLRRSPARDRLLYPLVGPWVHGSLGVLTSATRAWSEGSWTEAGNRARALARHFAYFSALAAVATARAGMSFSTRLTARDGVLTLPSLGALRTAAPGAASVEAVFGERRVTLRQAAAVDVVVRWGDGVGGMSDAGAWRSAYALPGLVPGAAAVPLDDLDPCRVMSDGRRCQEVSEVVELNERDQERWRRSWSGAASLLWFGGGHRVAEVVSLVRCLVPLRTPRENPDGTSSGTLREAFGAVLSSAPVTPVTLAATLVHEVQHAKLAALSEMTALHRAGPEERYFAPWRPDPRPFDGVLQGVYSHTALADFFQRWALVSQAPEQRESAWYQHARYREQVRASLPTIMQSTDLTSVGRLLVDQLTATCDRMDETPPPPYERRCAEASVRAARELWRERHAYAID